MSVFANAIVIDQLVSTAGGAFTANGETIDFDPDGNDGFHDGESVAFEDGSTAADLVAGNNTALATVTVTYEDGSSQVFSNMVVQTLSDGSTLVYAHTFANATTPVPDGLLSPVSVQIEPFTFDFITLGELNGGASVVDLGDGDPPCFVTGTLIETKDGMKSVELIAAGDEVLTRDHGYQVVRWAGSRHVSQEQLTLRPDLLPVVIASGALGNTRDLVVSPTHRMVIDGWKAETLFGAAETLVAARDLVNDSNIRRTSANGGTTYHHLMFDEHEVIFAEGAATESLHPNLKMLDAQTRQEILTLYPELEGRSGAKTTRRVLRAQEASLLQ